MTRPLPEGVHKELRKRSEDDPMRRFVVDCRWCQGVGCIHCNGHGTVIIEVDEDQVEND